MDNRAVDRWEHLGALSCQYLLRSLSTTERVWCVLAFSRTVRLWWHNRSFARCLLLCVCCCLAVIQAMLVVHRQTDPSLTTTGAHDVSADSGWSSQRCLTCLPLCEDRQMEAVFPLASTRRLLASAAHRKMKQSQQLPRAPVYPFPAARLWMATRHRKSRKLSSLRANTASRSRGISRVTTTGGCLLYTSPSPRDRG